MFEVTQLRVTCYRAGIRLNEPRMRALLTGSGRPGFYFRVVQEGEAGAGDATAGHMFRDLIPQLADRFRLVAPTCRSSGNPTCRRGPRSPTRSRISRT